MSDMIKYDFAGLDTLSGDINRQFQALEQLAGQLKGEVARLSGNWQSQTASEDYAQAQAHWDSLFGQAREQLNGLGRGVQNASNTMSDTDRAVGARFRA